MEVPEFAEDSLIDRPRVLAVVAEPPEIAPGQPAALSLMLAGTEDYHVRWSVCGAFFTTFQSTQYDDQPSRQGCVGGFAVALGEGQTAVLPGEASAALFGNLDLAGEILGSLLPPETIESVRGRVGLPLLVEATVETAEDGLERAIKRVLVSENETPHTNPPPPNFRFGEYGQSESVEIVTRDDDPMRCEAANGAPVRFELGTAIELAPKVEGAAADSDEEPWLESYRVIDARGAESERREKAFYSWFVTGGSLSQDVTETPLRNNVWYTPREPGPQRVFVVVRDGHGGTSACELEVEGVQAR